MNRIMFWRLHTILMTLYINDIVTIRIIEVYSYGLIGICQNYRIYIDLVELSWQAPIPKESIPKEGDDIKGLVIGNSDRHDSDYLASVRQLAPEKNPWYDPSIYKVGEEFIGEIDSVNTFGCWALHPNGADVRLLVDGTKAGLIKGQKLILRITNVNEGERRVDAEIIQ